jgi:ribosomal protein L11 methyltransferase
VKNYPALDISTSDRELLFALVDDFSPTAVEERGEVVRVFFGSVNQRSAARAHLAPRYAVSAVDVSDEDWARRSQENLQPVTVGQITIVPSPDVASGFSRTAPKIVIVPSMGFGTGHHATTRLCLTALQRIDLAGKFVLDVGTGSGVLAIAARLLGARRAAGIDNDADAIQSANENLALNPAADHVTFEVAALESLPGRPNAADVITANLTGALLIRTAPLLMSALAQGGSLILSGVLQAERDAVEKAFEPMRADWEMLEDGWVGLSFLVNHPHRPAV